MIITYATYAPSPTFFSARGKVPDTVITTCWVFNLMVSHFIMVVKRPFLFGVINVMAI